MSPDFKWLGFWISNPIQNMASFRQLKIWMNPDFRYPLNIQTQLESKIQMHPDFECWKRCRMWKVPVFECHSKTDFCSPNHSKNWTFCPVFEIIYDAVLDFSILPFQNWSSKVRFSNDSSWNPDYYLFGFFSGLLVHD